MENASLILRVGTINVELLGDTWSVTDVGISTNYKSSSEALVSASSIDSCFVNIKYEQVKCDP